MSAYRAGKPGQIDKRKKQTNTMNKKAGARKAAATRARNKRK